LKGEIALAWQARCDNGHTRSFFGYEDGSHSQCKHRNRHNCNYDHLGYGSAVAGRALTLQNLVLADHLKIPSALAAETDP
jgi:hypothetical protein